MFVKLWIFFGAVIVIVTTIYVRFKGKFNKPTSVIPVKQPIYENPEVDKSELAINYDEIVESYEKYSMYWSAEVDVDDDKIQLWFGVGMFKKLQLNVVRVNGLPVWIGRYYLDIGGPSKNPKYIYNHEDLSQNCHPEKYFYEISEMESPPDKGFCFEYSIEKNLKKHIKVNPKSIGFNWRYEERSNYKTDYQRIIASKPVELPERIKTIDFDYYNNRQNLYGITQPDPSQPIVLGRNNFCATKIVIQKRLTLCFVDEQDVDDKSGYFDCDKASKFFRRNLRVSLSIDRIGAGNVTVSLSGAQKKKNVISLVLQDVEIEQGTVGNKNQILKLSHSHEDDEDLVSIGFKPSKIGLNKYLFICSI